MTGSALIHAGDLPSTPLDAANLFHARLLPAIRQQVADGGNVVIAFDHAAADHRAWRLAMVQDLARESAPARVNAVVGPAGGAMDQVCAYLAQAPGVTGQMFDLDGASAAQSLD